MNFREAMELLKNGSEVRRANWDNERLRLSKNNHTSELIGFDGSARNCYSMDGYISAYTFTLDDYDSEDWEEYVYPQEVE